MDLRTVGFNAQTAQHHRKSATIDELFENSVAFLSDGSLVVSFLVPDAARPAPTDRKLVPTSVKIILLSVTEMHVTTSQQTPVEMSPYAILPNANGGFVLQKDSVLQLYDQSLQLRNEEKLPAARDARQRIGYEGHVWYVATSSPSRRTLVFQTDQDKALTPQAVIVRSNDLKILSDGRVDSVISIDDAYMFSALNRGPISQPQWAVVKRSFLSGEWQSVFDLPKTCSGRVQIIADGSLVLVLGCKHKLTRLRNGQVLSSYELGSLKADLVIPAESRPRFVVLASSWAGGAKWLDIGAHPTSAKVLVFDAEKPKPIYEMDLPEYPNDGFGLSISPSGDRLAFTYKGDLQLIKLP